MNNFWQQLKKPIFALAPMADVTDPAFRKLIAETGAPSVTWTEFVSADGLYHTRERKKMRDTENPLVRDLEYSLHERPIVAQFFSSTPYMMEYACQYALSRGFDGVDINMGCPDKSIEKQGAGAAHMKNPAQARLVIQAALKGVHNKIPVSVKTRLGYNTFEYETWLPEILKENISALTVHLRTRKEMSKVPAHWEVVPDLVRIVRTKRPDITLLCNGDVTSLEEAHQKINHYGIDGVMLGRAIFGNPWLFAENALPTHHERVQALLKLTEYFGQLRPAKHMAILKKHIKAFIKGSHDDAGLRKKLYDCITLEDLSQALKDALQ